MHSVKLLRGGEWRGSGVRGGGGAGTGHPGAANQPVMYLGSQGGGGACVLAASRLLLT
jgi:hypothetical protein